MTRLQYVDRGCAGVIVLALGSLWLAGRAAADHSIDYVIEPYRADIFDSWFFDMNEQGQVTGYVDRILQGNYTKSAVIYSSGQLETLSSSTQISGYAATSGFAINDGGDVVGYIDLQPHFFAAGGAIVPIQVADSYVDVIFGATGLNNAGDVLVTVYPLDFTAIPDAYAGYGIWNQGGLTMLSALDELYPRVLPPDPFDPLSGPSTDRLSFAVTGLNDSKQFAADIYSLYFDPGDPDDFEDDLIVETFVSAYIYDGQGGYHLLEAPSPGAVITPIDIEQSGAVLGWVDDQQLGVWQADGSLFALLPDPGVALYRDSGYTTAQQNSWGEVVAISDTGGVLLYDPVLGAWSDITPSIAGLGAGTFDTIQAFNDRGQFAGLATPPLNTNGRFGYVVSRVPEPSHWGLTLLALVIGTTIVRRRGLRA